MRRLGGVFGMTMVLAGCGLPDGPAAPVPALPEASAQRVQAHVGFLADDLLEGREAGTRGHEIAARYVASQFAQLGLEPLGDDGSWLQSVPLLKGQRLRAGHFRVLGEGVELEFAFESEFLPGIQFDQPEWSLEAPLVFAGQAVVAPEFGHDDLAGIDLAGRIALVLRGAPERFGNAPRAFHSSTREKLRALAERGAVGVVFLGDPEREARSPWARGAANWSRPAMRLRDADGSPRDTFPSLRGSASLSAEAARRLLAAGGLDPERVFAGLHGEGVPARALPLRAQLAGAARIEALASPNVVGMLPGSDPGLAREHVVYTAHLDHVGIGAPVGGDAIYNGALDNALGVGILIETARLAAAMPRPARSQVFVAVTAEEKGLLGAEHFAEHPGLDGRIVANINMDMPVMLTPQDDVIPIGIEHSSLGPVVERAAAELGIRLSPDPFPEEVVFVRSDQFAFVRRGIPAVYLDGGLHSLVPGVDGRALLEDFLRRHYHQPSDDLHLPIDFPSAARLARLNALVGQRIAAPGPAPSWNEDDFFGRRFSALR
ncbi:MAG: aminopeptidase [Lysobacteraceae bacterium]|nr:MAG: aminopeptidase [Xanthomonadaceae bacterium]